MAYYAYLRAYSGLPEIKDQEETILEYCRTRGIPSVNYIYDNARKNLSWRRRKINLVLSNCNQSDMILFSETLHLSNSLTQAIEILTQAAHQKTSICITKPNIVLQANEDLSTLQILQLIQELDKSFRNAQQTNTQTDHTKKIGRPKGKAAHLKLDEMEKLIFMKLAEKMDKRSIARLVNCSPTTLYNWLKCRAPK